MKQLDCDVTTKSGVNYRAVRLDRVLIEGRTCICEYSAFLNKSKLENGGDSVSNGRITLEIDTSDFLENIYSAFLQKLS